MNKILMIFSYDGNNFNGWAKQPKLITTQSYIEDILYSIFKEKINIYASSRTDKYVHAEEQNIVFKIPFNIAKLEKEKILILIKKIFNNKLIFVKKVEIVDDTFNPRKVFLKEYNYVINIGKEYNIFNRNYSWQYCKFINIEKFNKILNVFCGFHDFFNFCKLKKRSLLTIRRIIVFKSYYENKNKLIIKIIAGGFLRYQIRAMIGESIKCYENKETIENLKIKLYPFYLLNPNVNKYRLLAPPSGLYLKKIIFYEFLKDTNFYF